MSGALEESYMPAGDDLVCHECFGDSFLKEKIKANGSRGKCAYCGRVRKSAQLSFIADLFEKAFDNHFERTPSGPSDLEEAMDRHGIGRGWTREGQPVLDVLQEIGDTSEKIASDIRQVLEDRFSTHEDHEMGNETEFDSESHYETKAIVGGPFQTTWDRLEQILKSESRYFSAEALKALESIFDGIGTHTTYEGQTVVVDAGPGTSVNALFRARVFQTEEQMLRNSQPLGS